MKKGKLIMVLVVLVSTMLMVSCSKGVQDVSPAPAATDTPVESEAPQKEIILTVMTQQHAYFQSVIKTWEDLAEKESFKLTVMDPNFDNAKLETIIEDIIAIDPDGVAFAPLDNQMGTLQVEKLLKAGIPVVAYNMSLAEPVVPNVLNGNYDGGVICGENAARVWQENHPDKKPIVGLVNLFGIKEGDERCNGFMQGFNSIYPDAEAVQTVNGEGVRDASLKACEDMLQAHPEINVIYGINDDSSLGALDALKEINKGTIDKALVASTDGSEAALQQVKDETSAFKVSVGVPPRGMAELSWDTLKKIINGELAPDSSEVYEVVFEYIPAEKADEWLSSQYLISQ